MIDILRSVKKVCYSFLSMRLRLCISGLVSLLLALTAYGASFSSPQRDVEPSPSRPQSPVGTSLVLLDLDGDGLVDQATLGMGGWQNSIELDLSRTGELAVLPFSSKTGASGALFAQDLDGDGDTDLLWRGFLQPTEVIIWLNDGSGRFECLCPPEPHDGDLAIGGLGVSAPHNRRPDSAISPERTPTPELVLTHGWDVHAAATQFRNHRLERVWVPSCSQRLPTDRGPPFFLC